MKPDAAHGVGCRLGKAQSHVASTHAWCNGVYAKAKARPGDAEISPAFMVRSFFSAVAAAPGTDVPQNILGPQWGCRIACLIISGKTVAGAWTHTAAACTTRMKCGFAHEERRKEPPLKVVFAKL